MVYKMAEFSVTTGRDGSRSFEHDDRWDNGGSRGRGRGGYRGNARKFRGGRGSYRRGSGSYRGGSYRGGRDSNYGDNSYSNRGGPNPRSRLDGEGDDTMGDETEDKGQNRRFSPYGAVRPRGNTRWRRNENSNRPDSGGRGTYKRLGLPIDSRGSGDSEWYKILIPWGKNAEKEFILKSINSRLDVPFIPTYFHLEDKSAVFYINEKTTADAIRSISKQISMPNGYKMTILVKSSNPPCIPMGEAELDKLKHCMSARYDPPTKTLNLSSLHSDKVLSENQLYMSLARPQVMTNVVKIIKENIPELVGLILSKNKLERLDNLAPLVSKTPDLKVLDLSENKITHMEELRKLSSWKLEGLHLDGNTMCDKFSDRTSYVSGFFLRTNTSVFSSPVHEVLKLCSSCLPERTDEVYHTEYWLLKYQEVHSGVRRIFPKVKQLDGNELPPPITFDIEARTDLPKSKDSYFPNADSQRTIIQFLKEYFTVYDADNRSPLAGAYHESASFSLAMAYNGASQYKQVSLSAYMEESRNLVRANNKDSARKYKLLKTGNHIVPQLCLLPKTLHDLNSLLVDVSLVSPSMMCFNVQGVFKEVVKSDKPPMRAFSRTFVTVPGGHSMVIVNDMLTITNASQDQVQSAFKNPAPTPSSSPVPQTTPTNPFEGVSGLTREQQQMIASFINDSGMNTKFSAKCLIENGWDYAKAGQVFLELQQKGQIPAEAFTK